MISRFVHDHGEENGDVPPGFPCETQTVEHTGARTRLSVPHRAWIVAGVTFLTIVAAGIGRSSVGVLLEPIEAEFGWSRAVTSGAVSLNLVLYGLTAPFAAALMERFGVRRVATGALSLIAVGSALTLVMTDPWQLYLFWGLVVGLGTGSTALVFGAIIANRWFVARRGLVTGLFSAAFATGNLALLPVLARLASYHGWRAAIGLISLLAALAVPLVTGLLRDRPSDVGLLPYGATAAHVAAPPSPGGSSSDRPAGGLFTAVGAALGELRRSIGSPAFWLLAGTFFVCGWSTNGLIGTHFVAAAHDHGMPATTAASMLALIGLFDIFGTIGSGWLSDRVDPRLLLLAYYGLRGLSLLALSTVLGRAVDAPLLLFVVFYGLDWVATVPPTVALCREVFGLQRAGVVFGWVFASHMVGAGVAAAFAGSVREVTGSYTPAWYAAGGLCLIAAVAALLVPWTSHEPTADHEAPRPDDVRRAARADPAPEIA
jgi:MFS family permease